MEEAIEEEEIPLKFGGYGGGMKVINGALREIGSTLEKKGARGISWDVVAMTKRQVYGSK